MIRGLRGSINDLIAVVTRKQGGEENLQQIGVNVKAYVAIDQDFLTQHSKQPQIAVPYNQNPRQWSEEYLTQEGALALVDTFNPKAGKLDRTKKFLARYQGILEQAGKLKELDLAVKTKFGITLESLTQAA